MTKDREWNWSAEKTATLITMALANHSHGEIGQAVDKSSAAVGKKIGELRKAGVEIPFRKWDRKKSAKEKFTKPENELKLTSRKCLRCGEMFPSTHIGNRICKRHSGGTSSTWLYDNYGASMP